MANQFDFLILGSGSTAFAAALLVATGRRPNTDHISIERSGVSVNARGEIEVDQYLRKTVPHIFADGDVIASRRGARCRPQWEVKMEGLRQG